jgi:hypothetical protein
MAKPRDACCNDPKRQCGTRWELLRRWACQTTGKGVKLVELTRDEQGRAPFFAQPVGYDGRAFHVAADHLCDTEKLLHEVCHWLVAPKERRALPNYGLGPRDPVVEPATADGEEVTAALLERLLAPEFGLADAKIPKPDYNVADRRNIDWDACAARASVIAGSLNLPSRRVTTSTAPA